MLLEENDVMLFKMEKHKKYFFNDEHKHNTISDIYFGISISYRYKSAFYLQIPQSIIVQFGSKYVFKEKPLVVVNL